MASLVALRKVPAEQVPLLQGDRLRREPGGRDPGVVAVHVFGGILADREYHGHEPSWLSTGFAITTVATIVALLLAVVQFWVLRRARAGQPRRLAGDVDGIRAAARCSPRWSRRSC